MIKYEYNKRDVNRKHDRKSIKRFRRKRLGASIAYANTREPALTLYLQDILKGSKILKPNTVGIAISRCRC
jgi:hypothetical protein